MGRSVIVFPSLKVDVRERGCPYVKVPRRGRRKTVVFSGPAWAIKCARVPAKISRENDGTV